MSFLRKTQIMRLVWAVISSILIVSMIGVQESEATVCNGPESQFYGDDRVVFLGTAVSSEKIYYEEPVQTFYGFSYFYTQHEFLIDEVFKGQIDDESVIVRSGSIENLLGDKQYVVFAEKSDTLYHTIGCGSIWIPSNNLHGKTDNVSILELIKTLSAMENQEQFNDDFINILDVQIVKHVLKNKFVTIVVGKINENINSDFVFVQFDKKLIEGNDVKSYPYRESVKIDQNGFFGFYTHYNEENHIVNYELKVGILNQAKPMVENISFNLDAVTIPSQINSDKKICESDLVPILKNSDLSSYCIHSTTREKLIERNWGVWIFMDPILYPNAFTKIIEPTPELEPKSAPQESTLELQIPASFVDPSKDPQIYVDRYNNDQDYKKWFDENYSKYESIYHAVGLLQMDSKIGDE